MRLLAAFHKDIPSSRHGVQALCIRLIACLLLVAAIPAHAQQWGVRVNGSCTLQNAIAFANAGNNGLNFAASIGSATTGFSGCYILSNPLIFTPQPGSYILLVEPAQITLSTIDNYWYGPNALPPIASDITIYPDPNVNSSHSMRFVAAHVGDPSPTTANAFRFFYISGGLSGLPAGHLSIYYTTLENGYAKGGNSGGFDAGGGAGMGGAIFNQGQLYLESVTLVGNTAHGGNQSGAANGGGGGIGQDAIDQGGGFGDQTGMIANFGGSGGITDGCRGGGGGGFTTSGSNGGVGATNSGTGGAGGGLGSLGGNGGAAGSSGGSGGDGGGGGGGVSSVGGCPTPAQGQGGKFGSGGKPGGYVVASVAFGAGGGGGVGGGGGAGVYATSAGGGGGFGGGGGAAFSDSTHSGTGGFGGGNYGFGGGPGGAGMGGAIFNHRGTVTLLNVTATNNAAIGGKRDFFDGTADGGGLGAALFNLNGTVTIDFSTLAGNTLAGTNANDDAHGKSDGTVYSLAYGSTIEGGSASTAVLKINSSIIHGTHVDVGNANDDVVVNVVGANTSSYQFLGTNVIGATHATPNVTQTLPSNASITTDPQLGPLSIYLPATHLLPQLPVGMNSSSSFSADNGNCFKADGSTNLGADEVGHGRPFNGMCNAGAYQFDGNYIFANGFEPSP